MVFHALQEGHCPVHFADSNPHSWQKKAVFFLFPAIENYCASSESCGYSLSGQDLFREKLL